MATVPDSTLSAPREKGARTVAYEQFIEQQVRRTGAQVKWVEVWTHCVTLVLAALAWALTAVVIDHWIAPLGAAGRWFFLIALLLGVGAYFVRFILPLLLRRVNPVFAAHTIEEHAPTLKNALVNLLLLRGAGHGVSKRVLRAIEQQAATGLANSPQDTAVDRSRLIRLGYVLLGLMALFAAYKFLSPKDPLETVGRVAAPWADIEAPTRVRIDVTKPGDDTSVFTDEFLRVEASVRGLDEDEPVTLFYSTDDGRVQGQPLEMTRNADGFAYGVTLPPGTQGLQEDITYYVAAGDTRSRDFRVEVLIPPEIAVRGLKYEFPKYTGLPPREVPGSGDIAALEGTRVTVTAEANQPIARAFVDFDCNGTKDRPLKVDGAKAWITFPLRLLALPGQQGLQPEFASYQIRFTNADGHENPQPIRHKVEILRDLSPEVQIVEPTEEEIELPLNGAAEIKVRARDVDFALSSVEVHGELARASGDLLLQRRLLDAETSEEFSGRFRFVPKEYEAEGLKVGDVVRYWGVARDNKEIDGSPLPNVARSEKYRIRIVEPVEQDPSQENKEQPREGERNPDDPMQGEGEQGEGEPQQGEGQEGERKQGEGQESEQPADGQEGEKQEGDAQQREGAGEEGSEPVDPMTDPGKAFEKINRRRLQQQGEQPQQGEEKQPGETPQEPNAEQRGADEPQDSRQQGGDSPENGERPMQPGEQKPGEQRDPMQEGARKPQEEPGATPEKPGENPGENSRAGNQEQEPRNNPGEKQPGGDEPGDKTDAPRGSGEQKGAGSQNAEGEGGRDQRDTENPAGGHETPDETTSAKEPGEKTRNSDGTVDKPDGEPQQGRNAEGDGGDTQGTGEKNAAPPKGENNPNEKGGESNAEPGSGGRGQSSDDDKGSPSPQEKTQQKRGEKSESESPSGEKNTDAKSPSTSEKESDSEGSEEGDRSGGGAEGGGQSSNNEGTGGAGQNTAANEGASKTEGAGKGEDAPDQAGDKGASPQKTGRSGNEAGPGSRTRQGGERPGGDPTSGDPPGAGEESADPSQPKPSANPSEGTPEPKRPGQPGNRNSQQPDGHGVGNPNAGGDRPGDTAPPPEDGPEPGGDAPDLEHAKEATDLNLRYLKEELAKERVDEKLLEDLGMTREQLQQWVDGWSSIREQAERPGPAGEEARERLRNLGLGGRGIDIQRSDDSLGGLRESRYTRPPAEYAEQFRLFNQRRAKGRPARD